jgi:UTP--glucose-1-phosphate uridylyltransferase
MAIRWVIINSNSKIPPRLKLYKQNPDCGIVAIEEVTMIEVDKYGVIDGELL